METYSINLDVPPEVVALNRAVHGVTRPVDRYRLPDLWQLHLYRYRARLVLDGVEHPIGPGTITLVPPGVQHEMQYQGRSEHLYAHLRAGWAGGSSGLDLVMSAGTDVAALNALLESAVAAARTRPARAVADVWMFLLRLAERPRDGRERSSSDHVAAAMSWIEPRLAEPVRVPEVAAAVGVSHNHLTRLFRQQTDETVVAYVRRRRMELARHLLRNSTMSIGAVAATVGAGDLQAFNKACRSVLGASPRQVRGGLAPAEAQLR